MNKWDKIFSKKPQYRPLNEIFLNGLLDRIEKIIKKKPKTVIDFGCGSGDSLIKFSNVGLDVIGVDFSEVAINESRDKLKEKNINNVELILSDLDNLNIQNKADIFFCKLTYAFIENKEKFLDTIKNLMSDDSVFILITPVLYDGIKYSRKDKPGIAVNFEKTKNLLKNKFTNVELINHDYFGDKGDSVTFIITR